MVPYLEEIRVLSDLMVFYGLSFGFFEDGKGPLVYEGGGIGASDSGVG